MECRVLSESASLRAYIDREHFIDLLTYIIEDLVGTGATQIEIRTGRINTHAVVTVTGNVPPVMTAQKPRTWRFLQGLSKRTGGTLAIGEPDGSRQFEFAAPAI